MKCGCTGGRSGSRQLDDVPTFLHLERTEHVELRVYEKLIGLKSSDQDLHFPVSRGKIRRRLCLGERLAVRGLDCRVGGLDFDN